jgi:glycyl-tRNA synthetase beta subunit
MFLGGFTFNEYINYLGIARFEGLLLRYLSQIYKGLMQTVPEKNRTDELLDIIAYVRTMISHTDQSLIEEWEGIASNKIKITIKPEEELPSFHPKKDERAFRAKVRAELFNLVRLLSLKNYEEAIQSINIKDVHWTKELLESKLTSFYDTYKHMISDHKARNANLTKINKVSENVYNIIHVILDDEEDNMWFIESRIDIGDLKDPNKPLLELIDIRTE